MPLFFYSKIIMFYWAAISIVSVIITIIDKILACARARRVPEAALFILAALGGSAAMLITMFLIRHKTRKPRFMLGLPIIIILQTVILFIFCNTFSGY